MILVNGEQTQVLPVSDRGLQYGDGVWETIAIIDNKALALDAHLARLKRGLDALSIGNLDTVLLAQEIEQMMCSPIISSRKSIPENNRKVLKIIVTRGSGGRGYNPEGCTKPTRILSIHPWPQYPESFATEGIELMLCQTRLSHNPQLAGFKHLNRLEQVLARAEFKSEFQEGLVRDVTGYVIEATMSNLFVIKKDNRICTPDLSQCGIEGIARSCIITELQGMGMDVDVTRIKIEDVLEAKSLFLSNSIIKIWPVKRFINIRYEIPALIRKLESRLFAID